MSSPNGLLLLQVANSKPENYSVLGNTGKLKYWKFPPSLRLCCCQMSFLLQHRFSIAYGFCTVYLTVDTLTRNKGLVDINPYDSAAATPSALFAVSASACLAAFFFFFFAAFLDVEEVSSVYKVLSW